MYHKLYKTNVICSTGICLIIMIKSENYMYSGIVMIISIIIGYIVSNYIGDSKNKLACALLAISGFLILWWILFLELGFFQLKQTVSFISKFLPEFAMGLITGIYTRLFIGFAKERKVIAEFFNKTR